VAACLAFDFSRQLSRERAWDFLVLAKCRQFVLLLSVLRSDSVIFPSWKPARRPVCALSAALVFLFAGFVWRSPVFGQIFSFALWLRPTQEPRLRFLSGSLPLELEWILAALIQVAFVS
jgi:hypothetical protein